MTAGPLPSAVASRPPGPRPRRVARLAVAAAVVAGATVWTSGTPAAVPQVPAARAAQAPSLVVLIVVDQFRADYPSLYGRAWTAGLREIFTNGASFTQAAYPYGLTRTCPGHVSIATGALPSRHGLIDNAWFDPVAREFVTCTEDAAVRPIAFGGAPASEHHSAQRLLVPTLAEVLQRRSNGRGRVVSLSLKARSAIGLAGRSPSATVAWAEDRPWIWSTSTAFARQRPADVEAYVRAHPITAEQMGTWTRFRPATDYQFADQAAGEPAAATFPHLFDEPIRVTRDTPPLVDAWGTTPLPDAFLQGLALHLLERRRLGQGPATDFLGVSFSSLDLIGHLYGPRSHEVQDVLLRLDALLGGLLQALDARVGRDRYVLALTSDHGVSLLPEQAFPAPPDGRRAGEPVPGRTLLRNVAAAIEAALDKELGRGSYVEAVASTFVYFRPGVLARLTASPALTRIVETAALGARGVSRVYWAADLTAATPTTDPILTALRRSYYPGRGGDLAIVLQPNWVTSTGANHGSPYPDDTRVPVVLFGAGIAPGQHTTAATPLDVAPTLAALAGVSLGETDGRVLREALRR